MSQGKAAPSLLGETSPALTVILCVGLAIGWFAWQGLKAIRLV